MSLWAEWRWLPSDAPFLAEGTWLHGVFCSQVNYWSEGQRSTSSWWNQLGTGIYSWLFTWLWYLHLYSSWEEDEASLKLELGVLEQYSDYPAISPPAVMWCPIPDQHFTPAAAYTYYGNEAANIGVCYQAAVLLVDVPPRGDRKCEVDNTGAARPDITDKQREHVITWRKEGIQSDFSASEDGYVWDEDDDMDDLDDDDNHELYDGRKRRDLWRAIWICTNLETIS